MPSQLINLQNAQEQPLLVRVTTDEHSGAVRDIELALTPWQRYDFLSQFEIYHAPWENLSYGLLLRNAIAKYNNLMRELPIDSNVNEIKFFTDLLWECVGYFTPLEAMINRVPQANDGSNLDSIDASAHLLKLVEESYHKFSQRIMHYQRGLTIDTPKITTLLATIEQLKEAYIANFFNKPLTQYQLSKLFSMQNNSDSIIALGDYVASQLSALEAFAVQYAYTLTGGKHSRQLLSLNRLTKALSDVAAETTEKSLSLHAVRKANNRTPIPMTQIALSVNLSEKDIESAAQKWLSLSPYVSGFDRLEDIDKILCYVLGLDYQTHLTTAGVARNALLLFASASEGVMALILRTLWFVGTSPAAFNRQYAQKVDQWISATHHKISPVRFAKQWVENAYQRAQPSIGHERILDLLRDKSTSYYERVFSQLLTAQNIRSFAKTLGEGVYRRGHDWYYLGRLAFSQVRDEELASLITGVNAQYQLLKNNLHVKVALATEPEHKEAEPMPALVLEASISERWGSYQAWAANEYVALLDYLDTIAVGLADLINKMFRNEPGLATVWFAAANFSFLSVQWPSVLEKIYLTNAIEPVARFTNLISTSFTGADVAEGLTKKLVAAFLEWKLAFFACEGLLEGYHKLSGNGGFEFIAEVFGNPEKLTLGLMVLITSGWSLAFIPGIDTAASILDQPITNYFAAIINFFSNEAASCRDGIGGLNFIEYSFLGLKSWLFLAALFTGDPKVHLQSIESFCNALKDLTVLDLDPIAAKVAVSDLLRKYSVDDEAVINKILAEIAYLQSPDGRLDAHRLRGLLIGMQLIERSLPHLIAFDELTSLLQTVQKMAVIGYQFESQAHANAFFELLVKRYAHYNDRVSAYGLLTNRMDGRNVLASFYNRYCHQGDLTIVKMAMLVPSFLGLFYLQPIPYALRGGQYLVAKALDSPYMQHNIKKAFAEDVAMLLQAIALLSRMVYSAARAYSYLLRALVALPTYLPALIATGISLVRAGKTVTMDDYFDWLARIALHNISVTGPLRPLYSAVTTLAGTTHEDLAHQCAVALQSVNPRALRGDRPVPVIAPLAHEGSASRLVVIEAEAKQDMPEPSPTAIVVTDDDVPAPESVVLPVAVAVDPVADHDNVRVVLGELYTEASTACCTRIDRHVKSLQLLSTLTQRRLPHQQMVAMVGHLDPAAPYSLTAKGDVRRVSACEQMMAYVGSFFKNSTSAVTEVDDFAAPSILRSSLADKAANPTLAESLLHSPVGRNPNPHVHLSIAP